MRQELKLIKHDEGFKELKEGALGEGPRGGFRALIRAGRRHRVDRAKGRVKGRLHGGGHGNRGAQQGECTAVQNTGFRGTRGRNPTQRGPGGQQFSYRAPYHLRARDSKKNGWTKQLSIGNGKVMELKLIKHDEALKDLAGQLKEV